MTRTIFLGIVPISLGAIVFVQGRDTKAPAMEYADPVSQMLENIREEHNLPALAAAVVVDGKTVQRREDVEAAGFRHFEIEEYERGERGQERSSYGSWPAR